MTDYETLGVTLGLMVILSFGIFYVLSSIAESLSEDEFDD